MSPVVVAIQSRRNGRAADDEAPKGKLDVGQDVSKSQSLLRLLGDKYKSHRLKFKHAKLIMVKAVAKDRSRIVYAHRRTRQPQRECSLFAGSQRSRAPICSEVHVCSSGKAEVLFLGFYTLTTLSTKYKTPAGWMRYTTANYVHHEERELVEPDARMGERE